MKRLSYVGFLVLFVMLAGGVSAEVFKIEEGALRVAYDSEPGALQITGATGSARGSFAEKGGSATLGKVRSRLWGRGQVIEVRHPSGNKTLISLYEKLPFVVIQPVLINGSDKAITVPQVKPFAFDVAINGVAADRLRANGTFGLIKPGAKERGSYCYAAIADPATRCGAVGAWLTTRRGSGVVFVQRQANKVVLRSQIDYGALQLEAGKAEPLELFLFGFFADARLGLEAFADAVARENDIHLKPQPSVYCSWYHLYRGVTEQDFMANVAAGKRLLAPYGLNVMQLDDGWQEGDKARGTPKKNFLNANSQFPNGMQTVAEQIVKQKLVAGIWYMPFSGDADDKFFADKQDLFVRAKNGKPYNAQWGGNPLDMSITKVRDYVEKVAHTICRDWGYKYIKIDGLWNGSATAQKYINTEYSDDHIGESKLSDAAVTHLQAYRMGLKSVRKGAGDDVYILGCNSPQNMRSFSGTFGLVDGMRIGPDNGVNYPGILRGPVFGGRFYFLHNRVWQNDPDPVYVRNSLPLNEARMLCSWVTLAGQICSSSELYAELAPERLDLLRRCLPSHNLKPRPADYFSSRCPAVWLLQDDRGDTPRAVVGYFNWGNPKTYVPKGPREKNRDPAQAGWKRHKCPSDVVVDPHAETFDYSLAWIGLDGAQKYIGYEYWTGKFMAPFSGKLKLNVPEVDCRVVALRPAVAGRAQVLSTSRHITQGVIDIEREHWAGRSKALQGVSRVVANDPYELRVAAGLPDGPLKCVEVSLSKADRKAGASIKLVSQDGWQLRVLIESPESRSIKWSLKFR